MAPNYIDLNLNVSNNDLPYFNNQFLQCKYCHEYTDKILSGL